MTVAEFIVELQKFDPCRRIAIPLWRDSEEGMTFSDATPQLYKGVGCYITMEADPIKWEADTSMPVVICADEPLEKT